MPQLQFIDLEQNEICLFVVCKICEEKAPTWKILAQLPQYYYILSCMFTPSQFLMKNKIYRQLQNYPFHRAQVNSQYENSNFCSLCSENPHMLFKVTAAELIRAMHLEVWKLLFKILIKTHPKSKNHSPFCIHLYSSWFCLQNQDGKQATESFGLEKTHRPVQALTSTAKLPLNH